MLVKAVLEEDFEEAVDIALRTKERFFPVMA